MSDEIILNNLSDDSNIKEYISNELMPRIFHDIPINILNTGMFSLINEYMSQALEQQAFTSSFYYNENFITKAILPQSIFAEAAIFNIGYSFATPSSCNFLLEIRLEDLKNNLITNQDTGYDEFILDKNTKFNLDNGNVYSLDYDILIQTDHGNYNYWNAQYIINDENFNVCATNKNEYILYRITDNWLCLYITASEYERTKYIVVNNMMNGIANPDKVITCMDHICGFDVTYIDSKGNRTIIPHDHLLSINASVNDDKPYLHYIMDDPNNIRFKFQLNGDKFFVPELNSSYEITIYSCHGESANFTGYNNLSQPKIITASNKYSNNANVLKAGFVISPSEGGTDIGNSESVRRDTIEAYNTANVISSDHDIEEWMKTFYFKNMLYPFFFKRRDDPWGRVWSAFLALKDSNNEIFRTNTLSCLIPYNTLYNNNDNTVDNNEIIIPCGWIWTYVNEDDKKLYTVSPYTGGDGVTVEKADTLSNMTDKFVFSNPFGIRIQKDPFAIAYFNPWINESFTATHLKEITDRKDTENDLSYIYHAFPIVTNIKRTYTENYYKITSWISPTIPTWNIDERTYGNLLVKYMRNNVITPIFTNATWNYFIKPVDLFAKSIPMLPLHNGNGYIPFNPSSTYLCVKNRNRMDDGTWTLENVWIEDHSEANVKNVYIPITGEIDRIYGTDEVWGKDGLWNGYQVYVSGSNDITIFPDIDPNKHLKFSKSNKGEYYTLELDDSAPVGTVTKFVVSSAINSTLQKYDETHLNKIGKSYAASTIINVYFNDDTVVHYEINNAANIYTPYDFVEDEHSQYVFETDRAGANGILLYVDMKPSPSSGAVDYYRIPLSLFKENQAAYYVQNSLLPVDKNNMRVILHTYVNGSETGYIEMQPVLKDMDGSYKFEAIMYPLNQLVDIDGRINIASEEYGGGSWINNKQGSIVSVDATNPEFKISILIRSAMSNRDSEISIGDTFTGFRIVDQYKLDDVSLVQELKEMRSVVNFKDSSVPTDKQFELYNNFLSLMMYDSSIEGNLWNIRKWCHDIKFGIHVDTDLNKLKSISNYSKDKYNEYLDDYRIIVDNPTDDMLSIISVFDNIYEAIDISDVDYEMIYTLLEDYNTIIHDGFEALNIDGGLEIQLVPMVEYSLMNDDRFDTFVSAFTQVHKAIEPVIFKRLEGNNYLDCKLIATYGRPHSYTSDLDTTHYWPDLNVKVEFDCHVFNVNMTTNTISELKQIIKDYFNRLTKIHTAADVSSMDNNIYVSNLIQLMEAHNNVAYVRFKGWYTNEKSLVNGNYMDANYQGIIQKYKSIDEFSKEDLETYVPEMYVLSDNDITINII